MKQLVDAFQGRLLVLMFPELEKISMKKNSFTLQLKKIPSQKFIKCLIMLNHAAISMSEEQKKTEQQLP